MFRSLRSRVIFTALAAVALAAVVVTTTIALALGPLLHQNQRSQINQILSQAARLETTLSPDKLADRLSVPGFSVVITKDGEDIYSKLAGSYVVKTTDNDGRYITVQAVLPATGVTVTVSSLKTDQTELFTQILEIGIPATLLVMLLVALALRRAMQLALRPLDDMTSLATKIAEGELGGRLEVEDPNTELGRTAVAFDLMLDSLEDSLTRTQSAENRLRQLCADVAHELRSPISSMVAAADNLIRDLSLTKRSAAAQRALAEETMMTVVRDGKRASRIVGDLTLAAQLDVQELAKHEVQKQLIDAKQLIRDTVGGFALTCDFETTLSGAEGSTMLQADPVRIQQVINNLLSNANRWTRSTIDVRVEISDRFLTLLVSDDGPGVPDADRENIFGRFVRLDTDRARSKGGSGLGLSISKALAEAHGGTLVCLPNSGGARFELRLPIPS